MSSAAEEVAANVAAIAGNRVPPDVRAKIEELLKKKSPEFVVILKIPEMYKEAYGKELNPSTCFGGHKSVFEMVKSMRDTVEVFHHDVLRLWVAKYRPPVAPGEAVVVDEDVEGADNEDQDDNDDTNGNEDDDDGDRNTVDRSNEVIIEGVKDEVSSRPSSIASHAMDLDATDDDISFTADSQDKPALPPPARSVASTASSACSTRKTRLPPPPPSLDWTTGTKSVLGKRPGSIIGPDGKRMEFDDAMSINSVDESVPHQDLRTLDIDRRSVRFIPYDREMEILTYDNLILGRVIGVQEPATYVDTTYCARNVLEHLMEVKYEIRSAGGDKYRSLQDSLMKFGEKGLFLHSEAFLAANIDALTNWAITKPTNKHGELLVLNNDILYVADLMGGPGGFAEYILTKKQWEAKVYGFTFKDDLYDYHLPQTGHFPRESFEQWAGWDGKRGDGSIYKPEFVERYCTHLRRITGWSGVHVVIGAGKELTDGLDEDRKELRAKAMLMAEATIALRCLREGGTFVLRMYDLFTPFSVGLVYLMYRSFENVCIIRPEATRPGSSERFLICKLYKGSKACQEIANYLAHCHSTDFGCHVNHKYPDDQQADIVELVPSDTLKHTPKFYDYIYESNASIGKKQLDETTKLCRALLYRNDTSLAHDRITTILRRASCLWNCPKQLRQQAKHMDLSVDVFSSKVLRPYPENTLRRVEREGEVLLTYPAMERDIKNPKEWSFVCVGRDRGFYLSMGGENVFRFTAGQWKRLQVDNVELADHTLVYADIVDEITQFDGKQLIVTAFHIIDGIVLGNKDIRALPYNERVDLCYKFAKSMDKTARDDLIHIRAKRPLEITRLEPALASVHKEQVKGRGDRKTRPLAPVDLSDSKSSVFAHTGYLLLKSVKDGGAPADFLFTAQNRLYWRLDDSMDRNPQGQLLPRPKNPKEMAETSVCAPALVHHINNASNRST